MQSNILNLLMSSNRGREVAQKLMFACNGTGGHENVFARIVTFIHSQNLTLFINFTRMLI